MIIEQQITDRIKQAFNPEYLAVVNESHMHSVPENSETHFKVVAVAEDFANKRAVQRHQAVYALLHWHCSCILLKSGRKILKSGSLPTVWVEVRQVNPGQWLFLDCRSIEGQFSQLNRSGFHRIQCICWRPRD